MLQHDHDARDECLPSCPFYSESNSYEGGLAVLIEMRDSIAGESMPAIEREKMVSALDRAIVSIRIVDGCTMMRFGPFDAQTSSADLNDTNTKPVWKVWCFPTKDERDVFKVAEDLTREEAAKLAKQKAQAWRDAGRPQLKKG